MSKAISRRNFLMATGAVGAAGLLAACGGSSNNTPASSSTAGSTAAPAESQTLTDGPVSMSISWWGGDARHEAYQNAVKAFMDDHSNITVETTFAA